MDAPRRAPALARRALGAVGPYLGALLVATALLRGSQNMAQTNFALVGRDLLGLHPFTIGVVAAAMSVTSIVAMSQVASRIPASHTTQAVAVSLVILAVAFPLIGQARNLAELLTGVILLGAGGGLGLTTLVTAVGQSARDPATPGGRDRPIAMMSLALSISLAFEPFAMAGVLRATGGSLRSAYLWFALAPLVALAVTGAVLARRARRRRSSKSTPPTPTSPAGPPPGGSPRWSPKGPLGKALSLGSPRLTLREALVDRSFLVALLGELIYTAPFAAVLVFGALLAKDQYHQSTTGIQVMFGIFFAVSFAVRTLLVAHSPIRHKMGLFRLGALVTMAGIVLLALGQTTPVLLVAAAVLGIPHGLTTPLAWALVAENRSPGDLAAVNAHLGAIAQTLNMVLPLLLGAGIGALGYRPTFLLLLVPVAAAALLQHRFARSLDRAPAPARRAAPQDVTVGGAAGT